MLCLFQNLVLNIFYFCYFTPSVNHNLSLFSKLKWWFWSTPTFCKLLYFSLTAETAENYILSDHIKHIFKSSATSSVVSLFHFLFFFFKSAQPHKILVSTAKALNSCFLPPLSQFLEAYPDQTPNIFPSKHFCPVPHPAILFTNPLLFISTFFCPHGSHTAYHSAKSCVKRGKGKEGTCKVLRSLKNVQEKPPIPVSACEHPLAV